MKRGSQKIVYLVDDDEDDLMLIRQALESSIKNLSITEVSDGKKLLDLVSNQEADDIPALILMDMNMPRVTGMEALRELKANPKTLDIPVIMISTSAEERLIRKAYDEGVSAFMTKPVSISEYELMAQAVNVCFLNNYPELENVSRPGNFSNRSILVVEDSDDHWQLMDLLFDKNMPDLEVYRTNDKPTTLEFFTHQYDSLRRKPDLIVMDLYLPTRQDGLSLLDSIRAFYQSKRLAAVPIIVLSASDHKDDIKASYRHKANAYMIKSQDLNSSFSYFRDLCHFWWNTISLPKK